MITKFGKEWKDLNLSNTILYICIMALFTYPMYINLYKKQEKNFINQKKKFIITHISVLLGLLLLLYHHYNNTLWLEGFVIVLFVIFFILFVGIYNYPIT